MLTLSAAASDLQAYFDELRRREFSRLDRLGYAYLDYTGAALYPESLPREHHDLLREQVFANPHAESDPSRRSTVAIDDARRRVLRFLRR